MLERLINLLATTPLDELRDLLNEQTVGWVCLRLRRQPAPPPATADLPEAAALAFRQLSQPHQEKLLDVALALDVHPFELREAMNLPEPMAA